METNLIGELKIMKELNIKPNMSALAREYGCDRHTIKMMAFLLERNHPIQANGILILMKLKL